MSVGKVITLYKHYGYGAWGYSSDFNIPKVGG